MPIELGLSTFMGTFCLRSTVFVGRMNGDMTLGKSTVFYLAFAPVLNPFLLLVSCL